MTTHSPRPVRVCAFGTADAEFDRGWILLEALRESGAEITYCHFDLWAKQRHKTGLAPWRWLLVLGRYGLGLTSLSVQFIRSVRCDVLYVGYMGHIDLILAYCLNWRRRSTLVFDPCISMYNTLVEDRKIVTARGFVARVIRRLDQVPCRLADVVLTDTLHHGEYFASALGIPRERIHRVFVGAGKPFQEAHWRPAEGPFSVMFYAKFSPLHGVLTILDAARRLQSEEVCFTIVGSGQLEADVRRVVHELDLPNLEWIEWLQTPDLIERMRGCHVNLGIVGATTKAEMVIPNKVFQALAMGVPVITRESPAIRELLDHGYSGILCEADDGADLARAILECTRDQESLQAIGRNGREVFLQRASHPAIARQFFEAVRVQ